MIREIFIGYEPRQAEAFAIARESIREHGGSKVLVRGLNLADMQRLGFYLRPTRLHPHGHLIDELSITEDYDGAMATQFAVSRFLLPYIATDPGRGWVLFVDCDIMVRHDLTELFDECLQQSDKALLCVKHDQRATEIRKMDNQQQTNYYRKNWSSVMAWNLRHEAHARLTIDDINTRPGRDLHRFFWLDDSEIGELDLGWNWLAQVSPGMPSEKIKLVHWTLGGPWLPGFGEAPFAHEWRRYRDRWVQKDIGPVTSGVANSRPVPISKGDRSLPAERGLPWLGGRTGF